MKIFHAKCIKKQIENGKYFKRFLSLTCINNLLLVDSQANSKG